MDEAAGEVGEDLAGQRGAVGVDAVSAESWGSGGRRRKVVGGVGVSVWGGGVVVCLMAKTVSGMGEREVAVYGWLWEKPRLVDWRLTRCWSMWPLIIGVDGGG